MTGASLRHAAAARGSIGGPREGMEPRDRLTAWPAAELPAMRSRHVRGTPMRASSTSRHAYSLQSHGVTGRPLYGPCGVRGNRYVGVQRSVLYREAPGCTVEPDRIGVFSFTKCGAWEIWSRCLFGTFCGDLISAVGRGERQRVLTISM